MTWVMAAGGWMGLNGDSSVPEGGCNFTFMDCKQTNKQKWNLREYLLPWGGWKMYAQAGEITDIQAEGNPSTCENEETRASPLTQYNRNKKTNKSVPTSQPRVKALVR